MSDPKSKRPSSVMGDDERALMSAELREAERRAAELRAASSAVPSIEIHNNETPPPRSIDPAMQELIDRFWHLRKIDKEVEAGRQKDADRLLELNREVGELTERVSGIASLGNKAAELDALKSDQAQMRREVWGDTIRKPDEPPLAAQARSGRKLLAWVLAAMTAIGAAGAAGILVSIRKSGEAEGEERAWRAQVNHQLQMLFNAVFRVDMTGSGAPFRVDR